jgi:alkanesulfonate monooxygenase SsuD/methylene tetrahydromethanopterin reductase-like flavin-dependent oxidoreductase (luciferase family)
VRLGAVLAPFAREWPEADLPGRAQEYAAAGFDSLWAANSIGRGVFQPDPLITLAAAAGVTENVELGTGIVQLPLYHPVDLAHRVLSLAQICGNRLVLGVGTGSAETDFEALDRDYAERRRRFDENLAALRSLITTGRLGDVTLNPVPQGAPPPLFYGTWGKDVERAATEFEGWLASAYFRTAEELEARLIRYRAAGGRRAIVTTILAGPDCDLGELEVSLARYAESGFDDAVIMFLPGGPRPERVRALVD